MSRYSSSNRHSMQDKSCAEEIFRLKSIIGLMKQQKNQYDEKLSKIERRLVVCEYKNSTSNKYLDQSVSDTESESNDDYYSDVEYKPRISRSKKTFDVTNRTNRTATNPLRNSSIVAKPVFKKDQYDQYVEPSKSFYSTSPDMIKSKRQWFSYQPNFKLGNPRTEPSMDLNNHIIYLNDVDLNIFQKENVFKRCESEGKDLMWCDYDVKSDPSIRLLTNVEIEEMLNFANQNSDELFPNIDYVVQQSNFKHPVIIDAESSNYSVSRYDQMFIEYLLGRSNSINGRSVWLDYSENVRPMTLEEKVEFIHTGKMDKYYGNRQMKQVEYVDMIPFLKTIEVY